MAKKPTTNIPALDRILEWPEGAKPAKLGAPSARRKPSRGPTKAGKIGVVVQLEPEEAEAFRRIAERNFRSSAQHARYLICKAIVSEQNP